MSPQRRGVTAVLAVLAVGLAIAVVVSLVSGSSGSPGSSGSLGSSGSSGSTGSSGSSGSTSVSGGVGPPAPPAPSGVQFGANVNYLFNTRDFSSAAVSTQLQALRATGVTLARSDALWEASEPTAPSGGVHHYDWSFDDRIAATLSEHGLEWLPILDYSAPWAQSVAGQDHSPPRAAGDYAAYAGAFAARYGPGGTFWRAHPGLASAPVSTYEIWNEPDNPAFWSPAPDAARYADLYLAARTAIHASQPAARVIIGGLTNPGSFLPVMVAARPQLRGHVDGVAIHPYGRPLVVLSRIRAARVTLAGLGMAGVPLYATEFGWTTDPPGALEYAPERARPGYIESTVSSLGHLNCGLAAAVLYTWVTPERARLNPEDWYGINHPSGSAQSPDVAAFTAGLRAARSSRAPIALCPAG